MKPAQIRARIAGLQRDLDSDEGCDTCADDDAYCNECLGERGEVRERIANLRAKLRNRPVRQRRRDVEPKDVNCIGVAVGYLQDARDALHNAGAHHAADAVRRALKSAGGALRHAQAKLDARHEAMRPGGAP